jgi:hypothetical protein
MNADLLDAIGGSAELLPTNQNFRPRIATQPHVTVIENILGLAFSAGKAILDIDPSRWTEACMKER